MSVKSLYKFYQLNVYLDPELPEFIKEKYVLNAEKQNNVVDKYFDSLDRVALGQDNETECFDAGFDLFCPVERITYGTQSLVLNHKIKCSMKCGNRYVGYYLYSRSSTASKTPLRLANSVGVIDSGYRGYIIALFDNVKDFDFMEYDVNCGDRLAQICAPNIEYPMKVNIVYDEKDLGQNTTRGAGGFGSTGS